MERISVPRCYKSSSAKVKEVTLHCYSDACEIGYGNACYIGHVYENEEVDVELVMGKSRVAPIKTTTIPRLELTTVTTSVKVGALLKEEMNESDIPINYMTDSKIVIGYIYNTTKRFRVYVSNRLKLIHNYSNPAQWSYVDTK